MAGTWAQLFRIALADRLPDHHAGASGRPARGLPQPRAGAGAVRRRRLGTRPFRCPGEARADHRRHAPRAGQEGGRARHRAALPGDRLYACARRPRVLQAASHELRDGRAGARSSRATGSSTSATIHPRTSSCPMRGAGPASWSNGPRPGASTPAPRWRPAARRSTRSHRSPSCRALLRAALTSSAHRANHVAFGFGGARRPV